MSVVSMQKTVLIAPKSDKKKIFAALADLGTVEVISSADYKNTQKFSEDEVDRERCIKRLEHAFESMTVLKRNFKKAFKEDKTVFDFSVLNEQLPYADLEGVLAKEEKIWAEITRLEEISKRIAEIDNERDAVRQQVAELKPYVWMDTPFEKLTDTKFVAVRYGLLPAENLDKLKDTLPETVEIYAGNGAVSDGNESASEKPKEYPVVAVFLKAHAEEGDNLLLSVGFARAHFNKVGTAKMLIQDAERTINAGLEERKNLLKEGSLFAARLRDWKLLYDACTVEKDKTVCTERMVATKKTFVLEGWCPTDCMERTEARLKEVSESLYVEFREPEEEENPPALLVNSPVVKPFGDNITAMFGAPKYREGDPNPFVAFFFFLFFGFMLGDAGYGILLVLAGAAFLLWKKPVRKGSMIAMFFLCGFSTIFWGTIFGSWFAISEETMMGNGFGRFLMSMKLIDPLSGSETLIMFGLALALGAVQLAVGYTLSGLGKMKKTPLDGILNDFSWVMIFLGIGLYVLYALVKAKGLDIAGLVIALVGLVMLLAGGALGKKKPLSMIVGSFKNLYGGINVFSDVLSYARLFGLGLTTGVIGLVVNEIGMIFVDMSGGNPAAYIPAVIIWIGGHAFNFAINLLGVYVHNSRLQFVEFFGKFYAGEGKFFTPLGAGTKYVLLKDSLSAEKEKPKVKLFNRG